MDQMAGRRLPPGEEGGEQVPLSEPYFQGKRSFAVVDKPSRVQGWRKDARGMFNSRWLFGSEQAVSSVEELVFCI